MGISAIATWLNQHGYKKKKRQNNTLDAFASSFIKGVLDNPVYCGKLAYGPVSYTHLDVYKRQESYFGRSKSLYSK